MVTDWLRWIYLLMLFRIFMSINKLISQKRELVLSWILIIFAGHQTLEYPVLRNLNALRYWPNVWSCNFARDPFKDGMGTWKRLHQFLPKIAQSHSRIISFLTKTHWNRSICLKSTRPQTDTLRLYTYNTPLFSWGFKNPSSSIFIL